MDQSVDTLQTLRKENHNLRKLLSTLQIINDLLTQQLSRCECRHSTLDHNTQSNIRLLTTKCEQLKQCISLCDQTIVNDIADNDITSEECHTSQETCDEFDEHQSIDNHCEKPENDKKLSDNCSLVFIDFVDCKSSLNSVDINLDENFSQSDDKHDLLSEECEYSCEFADTKTGLFCEKKFNTKESLLNHVIGHTGDKPWFCEGYDCDYRAVHRNHLIGHLRKSHTGRYQFRCDWPGCEFRGPSRYNVRRHRIIHTGEKPFKCDWPGCDFSSPNNKIAAHKRLHTGERPYACDWPACHMMFSRLFTLRNHKRTHTGEKPFACDVSGCEYRSTQQTPLMTHKRKHH